MTTIIPVAAWPEPPAVVPLLAACLLHGDFHTLTDRCWAWTVAFDVDYCRTHPNADNQERRDAYQAAVERRMLDQHIRQHVASQPAT